MARIFLIGPGGVGKTTAGAELARVKAAGTSIRLLPCEDLEVATAIVVARQMGRGLGLDEGRETSKFARCIADYLDQGDIGIFSAASPAQVAAEMARALGLTRC